MEPSSAFKFEIIREIIVQDVSFFNVTDSEELSQILLSRLGLQPRKTKSFEGLHRLLLVLYQKAKDDPNNFGLMDVAQMLSYINIGESKIDRSTLYDYINRWLEVGIIKKDRIVETDSLTGKRVSRSGYRLNGKSLVEAVSRVNEEILKISRQSYELAELITRQIKNRKISETQKQNRNGGVSQ